MNLRTLLAAGALLALNACAPYLGTQPGAYAPTLPPAQVPPPITSGTIYQPGLELSLFADVKARRVGDTVTITGTGFTDAVQVAFNGTPAASFTVVSNTEITAVVPVGATTGRISVDRDRGTGFGKAFRILP